MKKLLFAALLIFHGCVECQNHTIRARVIRVIDGDTFDVKTVKGELIRVRMAYIDAPEISQNFGLAANYVLDSLISHKDVLLYTTDVDKYGRTIAVVYNNNANINTFMVKRGMAWVYAKYAPKYLYEEELEAKNNKKGLWQNPYPTPPFLYRKQNNKYN